LARRLPIGGSFRAHAGTRIGLARSRACGLGRRDSVFELCDLRDAPRVRLDSRECRADHILTISTAVGPGTRADKQSTLALSCSRLCCAVATSGQNAARMLRSLFAAIAGGAAANQHTRVGKAAHHGLTDDPRIVRIVHGVGGEAAEVQDDVSLRLERRDERRLHRETRVVATDGDAHGMCVNP
jgi:hypothetical protein